VFIRVHSWFKSSRHPTASHLAPQFLAFSAFFAVVHSSLQTRNPKKKALRLRRCRIKFSADSPCSPWLRMKSFLTPQPLTTSHPQLWHSSDRRSPPLFCCTRTLPIPRFAFRISPVYAPFYLALPSWHPQKNLRPLSPNDLQRFPPENTAPPRTFRCRVGRGLSSRTEPPPTRTFTHERQTAKPRPQLPPRPQFRGRLVPSRPRSSRPPRPTCPMPSPGARPCPSLLLSLNFLFRLRPFRRFGPLRPFPAHATPFLPSQKNPLNPENLWPR
jgi:hypothetical protein